VSPMTRRQTKDPLTEPKDGMLLFRHSAVRAASYVVREIGSLKSTICQIGK
jgi:hypothetical protein